MAEPAYWYDEQDSGPPTEADDIWFTAFVAMPGYPKLRRGPRQLAGQTSLDMHPDAVYARQWRE